MASKTDLNVPRTTRSKAVSAPVTPGSVANVPEAQHTNLEKELRAVAARAELVRLEKLRLIAVACESGMSQSTIAGLVGVSQPEVSRIVKRLTLVPEVINYSPLEVAFEYAANKISRDQLLEKLVNFSYSFSRDAEPGNPLGARATGTWDQVTEAYHRGLIEYEDYDTLSRRVRSAS